MCSPLTDRTPNLESRGYGSSASLIELFFQITPPVDLLVHGSVIRRDGSKARVRVFGDLSCQKLRFELPHGKLSPLICAIASLC